MKKNNGYVQTTNGQRLQNTVYTDLETQPDMRPNGGKRSEAPAAKGEASLKSGPKKLARRRGAHSSHTKMSKRHKMIEELWIGAIEAAISVTKNSQQALIFP